MQLHFKSRDYEFSIIPAATCRTANKVNTGKLSMAEFQYTQERGGRKHGKRFCSFTPAYLTNITEGLTEKDHVETQFLGSKK